MKKLSIFIFCLLLAFQSFAQIETSIGFKGGPLFSTLKGEDLNSTKWGSGVSTGGYLNLGLANIVQLQFEMLYDQFNSKYAADSNSYKTKRSYLSVPVLLKVRVPLGEEKIIPFVSIGQSVGYLVHDNTVRYLDNNETVTEVQSDYFKKYNLSTLFGLGVDFESKLVLFSLDLRYQRGNINISNQPYEMKSRNIALAGSLGFKINRN